MAHDPCRLRESVGGDGARLAGYAHGGHLTGWWPPGHDDSVLWMSPTALHTYLAVGQKGSRVTGLDGMLATNPGAGHTLPDVPPGHEAGFVCVEPAVLAPVPRDPQQRWSATMDLQWYRHS